MLPHSPDNRGIDGKYDLSPESPRNLPDVSMHVLDLVGVFAFAAYGAHRALQVRMDVLGVFACAAVTALGGGTVRAVLLRQPPSFFADYSSIAVVAVGLVFAIVVYQAFDRLDPYLRVLDAIGLATFALVGASKAAALGWGPGPMTLCALLTAAGGGVLCDLLTGRRPQIFYGEFYALPACVMGLLAWLVRDWLDDPLTCLLLVSAVFAVRMLGVLFKWTVWRPFQVSRTAGQDEETVRLSRAELNLPIQRVRHRAAGPGIRHGHASPPRQDRPAPPETWPRRGHHLS
jgi:uncharacterized membrane protein YeiH